MKLLNHKKNLTYAFLLVVFAILLAVQIFNRKYFLQKTNVEYQITKVKMSFLVKIQNPKKALNSLSETIKSNDRISRSCHALVHEIGHMSYEKYNDFEKAMKFQDELCNSGYLHGVIESHFSKTPDIFAAMKDVCKNHRQTTFTSWECYHGIGHGVMYYSSNDLPKSLQICQSFEDKFAKYSCINGVFMENFNTDQKLHPSNFLKVDNPFFPCPQQEEENKGNCYAYAPTFYLSLHKNDYQGALNLCNSVEENYRKVCSAGVGSQAIKENINHPKFVEKICLNANEYQIQSCIRGMVGLYINHFGSVKPAFGLCNQLEESNKTQCFQIVANRSQEFIN